MSALVFLHGWGFNSGVFAELAAELSPQHEVQALDLAGYGARNDASEHTLEALARDVALRAPEACVAVGWSLGAQVALAWARIAPTQVQRLILIAATPSFAQRAGWTNGLEECVLERFAEALQADAAGTLNRFVSLQTQGDDAAKRVARVLRARVAESGASIDTLRHGLRLLIATDLRESLAEIAQPALVIHGERDALTPPAAGAWLAAKLPRGRLATLPGAAHAPFVSDPPEVARLVREFCV